MKHSDTDTQPTAFSRRSRRTSRARLRVADGEHVKAHDRVASYATTVSFGVDSEGANGHKQVRDVMATAGLSELWRKILQAAIECHSS